MKKIYVHIAILLTLFVSVNLSAAVTYVHTDHLGSVVAESNASGQITKRFHYKPFGETIETQQDDIGYTGHKHDADLGLTYMQARYYDPVLGRFYGNDPIGYLGKNPVMSFNRYLYVNNNPYKYTDPTGMTCVTNQDQVACTIDLVNIGTRDKPNYVGRDEGISSGKVTETQLQKLEENITKAYVAAKTAGDRSVTIKGNGKEISDINATGNQVSSALESVTLRVDYQSFWKSKRSTASTNRNYNQGLGAITFNRKGVNQSDSAQVHTTLHEGMHLLKNTSMWDNPDYWHSHQQSFSDAADDLEQLGND